MYSNSHTLKNSFNQLPDGSSHGGGGVIIVYPLQTTQLFSEEMHCRWGRSAANEGINPWKWIRNSCRNYHRIWHISHAKERAWHNRLGEYIRALLPVTCTNHGYNFFLQVQVRWLISSRLNGNMALTYSCRRNIGMYSEFQAIHLH